MIQEFFWLHEALKELQLYPQITFEIFNKEDLYESVEYFNNLCQELNIEYV